MMKTCSNETRISDSSATVGSGEAPVQSFYGRVSITALVFVSDLQFRPSSFGTENAEQSQTIMYTSNYIKTLAFLFL